MDEYHKVKIVGKPYAGKPHVRFDEGAERKRAEIVAIDPLPLFLSLYSTGLNNIRADLI